MKTKRVEYWVEVLLDNGKWGRLIARNTLPEINRWMKREVLETDSGPIRIVRVTITKEREVV